MTTQERSTVQSAPLPPHEKTRLAALRASGLLDSLPEERFDRLTRMACKLFNVDIALVSLVDDDRQWFKSRCGLDVEQTSRSASFCAHTILENEVLLVPDTYLDPRFHDNPLVLGTPFIRFYAGFPIYLKGSPIGTFCIIDSQPRPVPVPDLRHLVEFAQLVTDELMLDGQR